MNFYKKLNLNDKMFNLKERKKEAIIKLKY